MLSLVLALPLVLGATEASAHGDNHKRRPLVLEEQGTFYVGGTVEFRTPNSTINVADPRSLPGNIAVNSAYVEYQIPDDQGPQVSDRVHAWRRPHGRILENHA